MLMLRLALVAALAGAAPLAAQAPRAADARSADAVIAADRGWRDAQLGGDVDFVDRLLLAGYRSVGPDGSITTKADILAGMWRYKGSAQHRADLLARAAAHPRKPEVLIFGDIAVLTWVPDGPDRSSTVSSCDVFVYSGSRWRAIYSQHTTA